MGKYLIRQEYFGASALDKENKAYVFFEQREADMLKLLQSYSPEDALTQIIGAVDKSVKSSITIDMYNFLHRLKNQRVLDSKYEPNYDFRETSISTLMDLPREMLKSPLRLSLELPGTYIRKDYLSLDELKHVVDGSRKADVLELILDAGPDVKDKDISKIFGYAQEKGLVTSMNGHHRQPLQVQGHPAFDICLDRCSAELRIANDGIITCYENTPTGCTSNKHGNIRDYNYSIIDVWYDSQHVKVMPQIGYSNTFRSVWND